MNKKKFLSPI